MNSKKKKKTKRNNKKNKNRLQSFVNVVGSDVVAVVIALLRKQ